MTLGATLPARARPFHLLTCGNCGFRDALVILFVPLPLDALTGEMQGTTMHMIRYCVLGTHGVPTKVVRSSA